jgi:hypothetical protein
LLKEGNTGGGFGVRGELHPEDFSGLSAAFRAWSANHSRQQHHHAGIAVNAEGCISGRRLNGQGIG